MQTIHTRIDLRLLAEVATALHNKGIDFTSKSELIRGCVVILRNNLGSEKMIETTEEAISTLRSLGIEPVGKGDRSRREVAATMQIEHLSLDGFSYTPDPADTMQEGETAKEVYKRLNQ